MQLPVTLSLRPSRRLALLLLAAHGGVFAAIADISANNLVLWARLLLLLGVILSFGLQMAKLYGRQRIVHLCLHADGWLEYTRRNDESAKVRIHPHSTATALLTILLFGWGRRPGALAVLPDALDFEDFRKLRLWLRWAAAVND